MTQPCVSTRELCFAGNVAHLFGFVFCVFFFVSKLCAQTNAVAKPAETNNLLVMVQNKVEVAPAGTDAWALARQNQILHPGDRVRTGEHSRAAVYLNNGMTIEKGEYSEIE